MKILSNRIFWGLVLILGGVLFLLQNLGIFQGSDLFWGVSLGIAGMLFLGVFFGDRQQWWALIPGMVLFAVGSLILLTGREGVTALSTLVSALLLFPLRAGAFPW